MNIAHCILAGTTGLRRLLIPGWVLYLIVGMGPASAEVAVVPLAYHPYPDDADPLGVPYFERGDHAWDYFVGAYSHLDQDRDGFDFPSLVVDGVDLVEGTAGGTYESTLAAYRRAWEVRKGVPAPLTIVVETVEAATAGSLNVTVSLQSGKPLLEPGLYLHWGVIEDDVYYRPPPAISNGVFVHRFTVRALSPPPLEPVLVDDGTSHKSSFAVPVDGDWDPEDLHLAVWVQNHAEVGSAFDFGEVLQATLHSLREPHRTEQQVRGVLLEMYTATWCPACLFGDSALDTLAAEHGLPSRSYHPPAWRYMRPAAWLPIAMGSTLALLAAPVVLAGRRPVETGGVQA